jgi:16S rRNA (guanine1207-N2)-methyltransferase
MIAPSERTDHYFAAGPAVGSAPKVVTVGWVDPPLRLTTDRGVFSHGRLDPGTQFLLRQAPPPPATGRFADLGCGYGPIALTLARRSPQAMVTAVDVNERARALCAANGAANSLANVETVAPDDVDPTARFDLIWSNPPIHVGKLALHALLTNWLGRLAPAATAVMVVHKHLGSDSLQRWLSDQGWPTDRLASSRGYRLLRSRAR